MIVVRKEGRREEGGSGRMSHSHKDELYVGPYRLEKTLGKGQTGKQSHRQRAFIPTMKCFLSPHTEVLFIPTLKCFLSLTLTEYFLCPPDQ